MVADITAIILTRNEEVNIKECIQSINSFVKRIIVVDSFSSDNTVELAKKMGAEVYLHQFETYAKQYKYAIENFDIKTVWTLRIDADERFSSDSAEELKKICNENMTSDVNGIVLRFKKNFLGRYLYHGGVYPWYKMNCYKTRFGSIEDRMMDEHIVLSSGRVVKMKHDCYHFDFKNLEYWIAKHNWYSSRETVDYFQHVESPNISVNLDLKTRIKMNLYYRLPSGFRAWFYYIYRYYIRLGFMDGKEGHIYAFLHAYWYRYLVDSKIYECKKMQIRYDGKGALK